MKSEKELIEIAKESPALHLISNMQGSFSYPKQWHNQVPLKVKMNQNVGPDMPFLFSSKERCIKDNEYYCHVNSYGALSAILPDGERLGLKPGEFEVIEYHPYSNHHKQ